MHSSYADHGTPIKIAFYDTSIVIESPGGLLPGLTVERVLQGVSVIRNPVLARVFSELGLIEQWGTGLPKAMDALIVAGLPPMDIEEGQERLKITVHIATHDPAQSSDAQVAERHQDDAERPQVNPGRPQVSLERPQVVPQLGRHGATILAALRDGPLRRAEVLSAIGLRNEYHSYQRYIVPLIEQGLVGMTNPDNPTARTQTYTLTTPGKSLLAMLTETQISDDDPQSL